MKKLELACRKFHLSANILYSSSAALLIYMEMCLKLRMNTHIHTLADTHCYSTRLQMNSAPSQVFQQQETAPLDTSIFHPLSSLERLLWLKTSPSFLMENKWHRTWSPKKTGRNKRPVRLTNWGDVQSEATKTPEVMREPLSEVPSTWSEAGPLRAAGGQSQGGCLHRRDAEFFPLGSQRDSSVSRCSTKTHGEEARPSSAIIRGQNSDNIFNTVRSESSKNSAEAACLWISAVQAGLWRRPRGVSISFTLQRAARREN